ncbi:MAG: YdcF family protein [Actinomycetes bacterium]
MLRLAVKTVAALVLLAVVAVLFAAGRVWMVAREDDHRPSDVIVVLGAAQFDGRPSSVFTARLVHARDLYKRDVAPRIVTVGGNRAGDRYTEASAGKAWLAAHGVPASRITAVGSGSDTLTSVRAVATAMQHRRWSTAVIVTDPWHSLRTRSMARDSGIDGVTSPTRQGPAVRTRQTEVRYVLREALGYLYYKAFHRSADSGSNAV